MTAGPRSRRFIWVAAGIVLLIGTLLGASVVLNSNGTVSRSDPGSDKWADSQATREVFSLGFVEPLGEDNNPGVVNLFPGQPGRVKFVAQEGHVVEKAGEVLLKLDDRQVILKVKEAKAAVMDAEAQLKHKTIQQQAAIDAAKRELSSAELAQKTNKRLADNVPPSIPIEVKLAADNTVEALKAKVRAEESKLEELIDRAKADLSAKEAQYGEARLALEECSVVAPCPGIVLRVLVHKEEIFSPAKMNPTAIEFAPRGVKVVRVNVLQEWASRIEVGQKVDIVDDTYASVHWSGTVKRVSPCQAQNRIMILEPFNFNDVRTLECIINIEEIPDAPLRYGQRVRVMIQTGK